MYLVDFHSVLYALSTADGSKVWSQATGLWAADQFPILVGSSRVYVRGAQNAGYKLPEKIGIAAMDASSGRAVWRYGRTGWAWPALDQATNRMYLACTDGSLVVLDASSGRVGHTFSHVGEHPVGLLLDGARLVWLGQEDVRCFDLPGLRPRWRRSLHLTRKRASPRSGYPATIAGGILYCMALDEARIYALDLVSGKVHWSAPTKVIWAETPFGHDDGYQFMVTSDDVIYMAVQPESAQLYWLSRGEGRPLGKYSLIDPVRVGYRVLDGSDKTIYVATLKSVEAIHLTSGTE